jgi:hypothetical protein
LSSQGLSGPRSRPACRLFVPVLQLRLRYRGGGRRRNIQSVYLRGERPEFDSWRGQEIIPCSISSRHLLSGYGVQWPLLPSGAVAQRCLHVSLRLRDVVLDQSFRPSLEASSPPLLADTWQQCLLSLVSQEHCVTAQIRHPAVCRHDVEGSNGRTGSYIVPRFRIIKKED